MHKKIVFTGGLSCGKTTTIRMLYGLGYAVILEGSESVIKNYKQEFGCFPWENKQNLSLFHEKIFYKQLENEKNIKNDITFFDRGIPDRLAFLKFDGLQIPKEMMKHARLCNYDKIFFFEGDESIYKKASHRPHDMKDSKKIAGLIREVYENLGYDFVIVPFCSKEKRLKIILEKIR